MALWLEENIALRKSWNHFIIYQKLAIFLHIVKKVNSNCDVQETFQYFEAIISAVFYKVLQALLIFYNKIIILPINTEPLDTQIVKNIKYFLYFENCISILNGIYLLAHISVLLAPFY